MKRERITAWITKYALTNGITVETGEVCHDISSKMFFYDYNNVHGNDWHRTPEDALDRAEEMRTAKIANLKNQIAKLERMTFTAPTKPD